MTDYDDYLNSPAWKTLKESKLRKQPICECCDSSYAETVHHLSYKRLWHENPNDVVSICHICHDQCHFEKNIKIPLIEWILRDRFKDVKNKYQEDVMQKLREKRKRERMIQAVWADLKTFKIVWKSIFMEYAKDSKHIYKRDIEKWGWEIISQADMNTFEFKWWRFQDQNYIYFWKGDSKKKLSIFRKFMTTIIFLLIGLVIFAIWLIFPPLMIAAIMMPYAIYQIWTDQ